MKRLNCYEHAAVRIYNHSNIFSCVAIQDAGGGEDAVRRYRRMFSPGWMLSTKVTNYWWNMDSHDNQYVEARVWALLLAAKMSKTGDL